MKKIVTFFLGFTLLANLSAISQTNISIIPKPAELTQGSGSFNLGTSTVIIANPTAKHDAEMLNFYLKKL